MPEDVNPDERVIRYVRTDQEIVRIDPDGRVRVLDLLVNHVRDAGYLYFGSNTSVVVGKRFSTAILREEPTSLIARNEAYHSSEFTTDWAVRKVLYRSSQPAPEGSELPVDDTAIRIGDPSRFPTIGELPPKYRR